MQKRSQNKSKQSKKRQYYKQQQASQKRGQELKGGLVGFLATCDQFKEKRAVKELFNLLNDATEQVHPETDFDGLFEAYQKKEQERKQEAQKAKEQRDSQVKEGSEEKKQDEDGDEEVKEPAMKRAKIDAAG